jgi:hypothetical protein
MKTWICVLALSVGVAACDRKDEPGATPSTPATATPAPGDQSGATTPATAQVDQGEIPTEADFEEEAEQKITAENLKEELDKLEKEIEAN